MQTSTAHIRQTNINHLAGEADRCPKCKSSRLFYDRPRWQEDVPSYRCPICGFRVFNHSTAKQPSDKVGDKVIVTVKPAEIGISDPAKRRAAVDDIITKHKQEADELIIKGEGYAGIARLVNSLVVLEPPIRGEYARDRYTKIFPKSQQATAKFTCLSCNGPISYLNKSGLCSKCR